MNVGEYSFQVLTALLIDRDAKAPDVESAWVRDIYARGTHTKSPCFRNVYIKAGYIRGTFVRAAYLRGIFIGVAYIGSVGTVKRSRIHLQLS